MSAIAAPPVAIPIQPERGLTIVPAVPPSAFTEHPGRRSMAGCSRIILLIPARDEEAGIAAAMRSVENQTVPQDRAIVMSDNSIDRTVAIARARPGWEVWETIGTRGKKGGALNQAWARLEPGLDDRDYLVTMDADTLLDPAFIDAALAKYQQERGCGVQLRGVCANFLGLPLDTALGVLQTMEYARAEKINRSRSGVAPVLAGAATMFSVAALRSVYRERGNL